MDKTPRGAAGQAGAAPSQAPKPQNVKIQIPESLFASMLGKGGGVQPPPGAGAQNPQAAAMIRAMLARRAAMGAGTPGGTPTPAPAGVPGA